MDRSLVNIELLFTTLAIDKHCFFSHDSRGIWSTDLNRYLLQIPNSNRLEVLYSLCKLKFLSKVGYAVEKEGGKMPRYRHVKNTPLATLEHLFFWIIAYMLIIWAGTGVIGYLMICLSTMTFWKMISCVMLIISMMMKAATYP